MWSRKGVWHFQNLNFPSAFLKSWKCFIPRRDSAEQIPKEVQLFLLMSYFVLGNVYCNFNFELVIRLFETPRMFYPPKGLCDSRVPKEVQLFFTYVLFRLGNVYWTFKIPTFRRFFWDPPNVLSPGGTLQSRARKGSNCFYLCFFV